MTLHKWVEYGWLRQHQTTRQEIGDLLDIVDRDLVLTTNIRIAEAPGNVFLKAEQTGLPKDSVANVSQVLTVDKSFLTEKAGRLRKQDIQKIESGLRLVLGL